MTPGCHGAGFVHHVGMLCYQMPRESGMGWGACKPGIDPTPLGTPACHGAGFVHHVGILCYQMPRVEGGWDGGHASQELTLHH